MNPPSLLGLIFLLLFAFGALAYGTVFAFWIRQYAGTRWGQHPSSFKPVDVAGGLISLVSFFWFLVNLLLQFAAANPIIGTWPLKTAILVMAFLYPPLIMQATYAEIRCCSRDRPAPRWRIAIWVVYITSQVTSATLLLAVYELISLPGNVIGLAIGVGISAHFAVACVYSALLIQKARKPDESLRERSGKRWTLGMLVFLGLVLIWVVLVDTGTLPFADLLDYVLRIAPLMFLFVGTYYEDRFEFYDLFVKRGVYLILAALLLTAYFALTLPWVDGFEPGWARPWLYAIATLPVALALPWLNRRLVAWLDDSWFGRQYTVVEAVTHFIAEMRSATTEEELKRKAEASLTRLYGAPAVIDVDLGRPKPAREDSVLEIPIRAGAAAQGVIRLGRRANDRPFFSEDVSLVSSLAGVFAFMLENVRLQERKQELCRQASRSELKALRAQINPHFLFNALNSIAGLIHKDPFRADKAIEQLAEVFRYTLRRSDSEWVRLEDEIEFVRAYLEVEQARFGDRLEFAIHIEPDLVAMKVPTMMVQILVENAVKHGVCATCDPGMVTVRAGRESSRLRIDVSDNGPGFDGMPDCVAGGTKGPSEGYGLSNVRARLDGYYGDEGELTVHRDPGRGVTMVSILLPMTPASSESAATEQGAPARRGSGGGPA